MEHLGLIAGFGALGVLSRYGIGVAASRFAISSLPWPTLVINILGSFAIGLIWAASEKQMLNEDVIAAIRIGPLGGFTTFSAMSFETLALLDNDQKLYAMLYLFLSPVFGVAACYAGRSLIRSL